MEEKEIASAYLNFVNAKISLDKQNNEIKKFLKQKEENKGYSLIDRDSDEWLQEYFIIYNSYKHEG